MKFFPLAAKFVLWTYLITISALILFFHSSVLSQVVTPKGFLFTVLLPLVVLTIWEFRDLRLALPAEGYERYLE